ncbi:MAG: stage III sporulation protein AE [Syntrophomonadaceae bacterium]|nr:stage III sporulation protein AE [Syntrophomonadaceae bacterium]
MKKAVMFLIMIFLLLPLPTLAADVPEDQSGFSFQDTMKSIDLDVMEGYKSQIDGEISSYIDSTPVREWFIDFVKGDWEFNGLEAGQNLVKYLFKEIVANSDLLGKLLILSVIAALLINIQTSFSAGVGQISYLACFLALCAIALGSFKIVLSIGQQTIDNMVAFMLGMLPQMLVLTAGLGNINASVILFPIMMTTATAFANAIKHVVFPLIIMSAILSLVNQMSEGLKVQRLAKFFGELAKISLGFFVTVFVGIVTIRAIYASALDKVALRTTKYVTDNAIPVIGKMFSDTIEVAAGYVVLLKQAFGIFGVLIVLGIIVFPLAKIVALAIIYKIAAAVAEPLGDSRIAAILETMGAHLMLMLSAVAAVGLMFLIMIGIVAGISNHIVMLR